jgi:CAAX prenyl protease-like protein
MASRRERTDAGRGARGLGAMPSARAWPVAKGCETRGPPMNAPPSARLWPYLAPYGVLLGLAELGRWLPALEVPLRTGRVVVPALLVALAWRSGAYPELRRAAGRARLLDVGFGLTIAALWVAPYLAWPELPRGPRFDPALLGAEHRATWLTLRLAGFALVSPLVEELFVRSFLHRVVEAWPHWRAFGTKRVGQPHALAFGITSAWFALSHVPWEWWVAVPTALALNGWLYLRGNLRALWLAHAVTNAAIAALVTFGPWDLWEFL